MTYEVICFIHATCLKKAGHRELAENHYLSLRPIFKRHLVKDLIKKVFGLMLIPLQDNRKLQQDHLKSVAEYMLFLQTEAETQPAR